MTRALQFIIVLWLAPCILQAQNVTDLYFKEVRAGKYPSVPKNLTLPENASAALTALHPYLKDSVSSVRAAAYSISKTIGTTSKSSPIRTQAVTQLISAAKDNDSGNVGVVLD